MEIIFNQLKVPADPGGIVQAIRDICGQIKREVKEKDRKRKRERKKRERIKGKLMSKGWVRLAKKKERSRHRILSHRRINSRKSRWQDVAAYNF